jgi:hypothetical protein
MILFRLDDPHMYHGLLHSVRKRYEQFLGKGLDPVKAFLNSAVFGSEDTQRAYFNNRFGANASDIIGLLGVDVGDPDQSPSVSISEMKDTAVCMQRAAVEHNLLKILGIPSRLETGMLIVEQEGADPKTEHHAFLRLPNEAGEERIVDPQNPVFTLQEQTDGTMLLTGASVFAAPVLTHSREDLVVDRVAKKMTRIDGSVEQLRQRVTYVFAPLDKRTA